MSTPSAAPGDAKPGPGLLSAVDAAELAAHPGQSACVLLDSGPLALVMRSVLADEATATIDLQTYIYEDDESGVVLMDRLRAAAERGVHVRLLIDDAGIRTDDCLPLLLDAMPDVEVRVFNPFRWRPRWTRLLQFPFEFRRLNHRMHNKLLVVDGKATIVGGRNISGPYFGAHAEANFTDLDVLLLGPVAGDARQCFERYWSSDLAVPLQVALGRHDLTVPRARLERYAGAARFTRAQEQYRATHEQLRDLLQHGRLTVHWAATKLLADDPSKALSHRLRRTPQIMFDALGETWANAEREVLAATAYFVPGRRGTAALVSMMRRGVRVSILTNSLASSDVPAVHAGYSKYRRRLLRAGVALFEYQRFGNQPRHRGSASKSTSLHSKTIVVDRRLSWIGSFNLDPRSSRLNTEVAVLLDSPALASDLARRMERDLAPDRSWRVMMVSGRPGLRWGGYRDGLPVVMTREPDASLLQRAWAFIARHVPGIERLL